jgi:hypothetical protein
MTDINIGSDAGFGATKMFSDAGSVVIPSCVVPHDANTMLSAMGSGLRVASPPPTIRFGDSAWLVGERAFDWGTPLEGLDLERMSDNPEIRALMYAGWSQLLTPGQHTGNLLIGLPVALFQRQVGGDRVRRSIARAFTGSHKWVRDDDDFRLDVAHVAVTPQTAGALFDFLLDENGRSYPDRRDAVEGEVGVINLGMGTADMMVVRGTNVVPGSTAGRPLGCRVVLHHLHRVEPGYSIRELDHMVRTDSIPSRMTTAYNTALDLWQRQLAGFIDETWGERRSRFAYIIAIGGGALMLHSFLEDQFGDLLHIPDDPVLSTARGLYKISLTR